MVYQLGDGSTTSGGFSLSAREQLRFPVPGFALYFEKGFSSIYITNQGEVLCRDLPPPAIFLFEMFKVMEMEKVMETVGSVALTVV